MKAVAVTPDILKGLRGFSLTGETVYRLKREASVRSDCEFEREVQRLYREKFGAPSNASTQCLILDEDD